MLQVVPFPLVVPEIDCFADLSDRWAIVAHQYVGGWKRRWALGQLSYSARGPRLRWEWNIGGKEVLEFKRLVHRKVLVTVIRRDQSGLILYAKYSQPTVVTGREPGLATYCPHHIKRIRSD